MKKAQFKKNRVVPTCAVTAMALFLCFSFATGAYAFSIDMSPKIINIASERVGEIRVFTNMRYSQFLLSRPAVHIYVNDSEGYIDNVNASSDSLGNLILRFDLEDLLALEDALVLFDDNWFGVELDYGEGVVELMDPGDAYIVDKKGR